LIAQAVVAQKINLSAPASQSTAPGAWISLGFVVSASDRAIDAAPQVELPLGWSVVVPPPALVLSSGERQTLTMAVAVPKDAPAGSHQIIMILADQSASAEVIVEGRHTIEWLGDGVSGGSPKHWQPNRPWVETGALLLTGNQSLDITLVSRVPAGVLIDISKRQHRLRPGLVAHFSIEVRVDPRQGTGLPQRLPLAIDVVDADSQEIVLSRRWVLMPLTANLQPARQRPWVFQGFFDRRFRLGATDQVSNPESQWGLRGGGSWGLSGERTFEMSWHRDVRWGRYVGFKGKQLRWRIGHQVFLGDRLDGLAHLGQGLSASWTSGPRADAWRVGWIQFQNQEGQYTSPWWSWGSWRMAYIHAVSNDASRDGRNAWWSLSYQQPVSTSRAQTDDAHHWSAHLIGNSTSVAGRLEYRYQAPDETRWSVLAESIPKNHLSELPAGIRVKFRSWHGLTNQASIQTSLLASREPGIVWSHHHRYHWMGHYWRPIRDLAGHSLDNFQVGLGVVHRRHQVFARQVSSNGPARNESSDRSSVSLRLRGHVGSWHLSGRIDTKGRLGLATHWMQPGIGRWRLSRQNAYSQVSLDSLSSGPWRCSVALEKRQALTSSNGFYDTGSADHHNRRADQWRMQLTVARQWQSGQEWSVALSSSLTNRGETMVWLRHRWRAEAPSPLPMIRGWVGDQRGQVITGCAHQLTATGPHPVVGLVVSLNQTSTVTDREGCYRFAGVEPGSHRLAIEPRSGRSAPDEGASVTGQANSSGWLLTSSESMDLWLEPTLSPKYQDGETRLRHDWAWVQPARMVATIIWPNESPVDKRTQEAVLNQMRLVGTCQRCPAAHQKRTAKRNADGQWVVEQLMPGDWRWQWASVPLPSEHAFAEPIQSLSIAPRETKALVWTMRYSPRSIQWQPSEVVELIP